ncbi:MAG TPA: xanthine dehydrogenase family protein molybdopterin-binding subunit [Chloroflexota bacterium]
MAVRTSPPDLYTIGKRLPKIDAWAKVAGTARFTDDIVLPRMAYGRLLRSPYPHARILHVDSTRAEQLSGVVAVATGRDLPRMWGIMPTTVDEYPLAVDKARYVGDAIAAVAALDEETAEEACRLIEVEYEVLEPIMSIAEALDDSKPKIHDKTKQANVFKEVHLEFGDLEQAFAESDLVIEDEYWFEGSNHVPIETHSAVADWGPDGKVTLWTATQVVHYIHRELAKVFQLPLSHVRIIAPPVGGGFGGKCDPFSHEAAAVLLSKKSGRPVKITLDREEVFYAHRGRHPVKIKLKTGVDSQGNIKALHSQTQLDGGGYASYGIATTFYTGCLIPTTYKTDAFRFDSMRLYTNKPACGPKRGHGSTQPRFAVEIQLDKIAEQLGQDPAELRKRIAIEPWSKTVSGFQVTTCGLVETIDRAVAASGWKDRFRQLPFGHGIGIASSAYMSGAGTAIYWNDMPHSGVQMKIDRGGGVAVFCGVADIGQGCDSTLAYIAAEELGIEVSDVRVLSGDSDLTPVDLGSYSSRVTLMAGNACRDAARKLRKLLFEAAAEHLEVPEERLTAAWRRIFEIDNPDHYIDFDQAVWKAESKHGTLGSTGSYTPPHNAPDYRGGTVGITPAYSYTTGIVELHVDVETGQIKVDRAWAAHDLGKALNPVNAEAQIEGCAYMGMAEALGEEQVFRGGLHKKPSLLDYKIPTFLETPPIEVILVETDDPEGPYGAKEAGEGPLNPFPPAFANAVYDAIGIRFDKVPITPTDVLKALRRR